MFVCPQCGGRLARTENTAGVFWVCAGCGGKSVGLGVLRKAIGDARVNAVWQLSRQAPTGEKPCPTCGHRMAEVNTGDMLLDVCKICQFIWFDPREYEQIPSAPTVSTISSEPELPQKAREAIALYQVQEMAERAADEGPPDESWKTVPALFGFPVECDEPPLSIYPLATWAVGFVIALVSIVAFFDLADAIERFGLVPAQAFKWGGVTLLTSFFLHGGIMHLVGNLYFFLVFGDNVEEYLGRAKFLLLLLAATLGGDIAHITMDPNSTVPCVGASGGIAGVITFYALQFPNARLGMMWRVWWSFRWFRMRAWVGLLVWILLQLIGVAKQIAGFSHVSALAHLGGAAVGFVGWVIWSKRSSPAALSSR